MEFMLVGQWPFVQGPKSINLHYIDIVYGFSESRVEIMLV